MPAIVSYYSRVHGNWSGFYDDVDNGIRAFQLAIIYEDSHAKITYLSNADVAALHVLSQDTATQDQPTRSEMVDHWVWAICDPLNAPTVFTPAECYAILYEMLGQSNVHVASYGAHKIEVIKVVRLATGLGLRAAKDLVESAPFSITVYDPYGVAQELRYAGATVKDL